MKNLHVLPTDKPSRLFITEGKLFNYHKPQQGDGVKIINQNIYITSDEEIKEGDWFLDDNNSIGQSYKLSHVQFANPKKIILTTDFGKQPRVQAIDDEFLEWFVNNPSCEEVEVEEKEVFVGFIDANRKKPIYDDEYKIIIPKEEAKQETLEEAARNYRDLKLPDDLYDGFIAGAKWQQERMYSVEDMIRFANIYSNLDIDELHLKYFNNLPRFKKK